MSINNWPEQKRVSTNPIIIDIVMVELQCLLIIPKCIVEQSGLSYAPNVLGWSGHSLNKNGFCLLNLCLHPEAFYFRLSFTSSFRNRPKKKKVHIITFWRLWIWFDCGDITVRIWFYWSLLLFMCVFAIMWGNNIKGMKGQYISAVHMS